MLLLQRRDEGCAKVKQEQQQLIQSYSQSICHLMSSLIVRLK
jgi:hypothetical protein